MDKKQIDGKLLHRLLISGYEYLNGNINYLNEINVFPIADGDTGNNMKRTYEMGVNEIKLSSSFSDVLLSFMQGMLLGSRGNSGMILSQYFWGVYEKTKGKNQVSVTDFYEALKNAYKTAYKSVLWPVEGTILTVMRESIENLSGRVNGSTSVQQFFDFLTAEIFSCLQRTPEKLDILRANNVVDSGGAGFYLIFEGIKGGLSNLGGAKVIKESLPVKRTETKRVQSDLTFRFCTEFLMKLKEPMTQEYFIELLKNKGDSLIVSVRDSMLKVHIHTNESQNIMDEFCKFGDFIETKIDDMVLQQELAEYNLIKRKHDGYILVSFAHSEGIIELFSELGCDIVFTVPQNYQITKDNIRFFIDKFIDEQIIILPNDEKIYKAAQSVYYYQSNVHIIDSQNIVKSYFLLSLMIGTDNLERTLKNFRVHEKSDYFIAKILSITISNKKYYACFFGNEVVTNKSLKDLLQAKSLKDLLQAIINSEQFKKQYSVVIAFYGQTAKDEEIQEVSAFFNSNDEIEFASIDGKLEDFDFIIGAM